MNLRVFIAAELDTETRNACAAVAARLERSGWPAKFVAPASYHVTVAFLGSVVEDRVVRVADAIRAAAADVPALEIRFDAVGAFPNERCPRTAWVGSASAVPAFGTLCGVVRSSLSVLGFTFDRHADPHVTIARADRAPPLPRVAPPRAAPLRIERLTLYRSFTEASGARYEALDRFALSR